MQDVARDPAVLRPPDAGAPWLDLLATVGGAYGQAPIERLTEPARLGEWLEIQGLAPDTPPQDADVAEARRIREVLRPLGLAVAAGQDVDPQQVAELDAVVAGEFPPRLAVRGGRVVARAPATASVALAHVARQAAEHLTGPQAAQLGMCADHDCSMLFLDPGGRRRWCSAATCGVRHRVRAHRARLGSP